MKTWHLPVGDTLVKEMYQTSDGTRRLLLIHYRQTWDSFGVGVKFGVRP